MSLLKNILIAGLFLSVFVAVSPAFAKTINCKNYVNVTNNEIIYVKLSSENLIKNNLVST